MDHPLFILFLFSVYLFAIWRLMKAPYNLDKHPSWVLRSSSAQFFLWTASFLIVTDYGAIPILMISTLFTRFYSRRICRFKSEPCALLTVVPDLLDKSKAQIHLSKPTDAFSRQHYRELTPLLEQLTAFGFTRITLTSPMFYKTGELRALNTLARITNKQWKVTGQSIPWITKLWEISSLALLKKTKPCEALRTLPLTRWYQITLQRTG